MELRVEVSVFHGQTVSCGPCAPKFQLHVCLYLKLVICEQCTISRLMVSLPPVRVLLGCRHTYDAVIVESIIALKVQSGLMLFSEFIKIAKNW